MNQHSHSEAPEADAPENAVPVETPTAANQPAEPEPPRPTKAPPAPAMPVPVRAKNPLLAAFFSIAPGVGNLYNGLYLRGVTFFSLFVLSIYLAANEEPGIFGPVAAFLWIFNVIDAYRQASLINYGYAQDLGMNNEAQRAASAQEKIFAGGALLAMGAIGLADRWLGIDLESILDQWPILLVAVGAWLLWSALSGRDKTTEDRY